MIYFVNVGRNLAKNIPIPEGRNIFNIYSYLNTRNESSMFLEKVDEAEILNVVTHFKSKKSKDCDDINMFCLKNVIHCITKPLTHICNQSFITRCVSNKDEDRKSGTTL